MQQLLWVQIGLIRAKRPTDGGSELSDLIASTNDDARIEKLLHKLLTERLCQQFESRDCTVWLEVMYFRPPSPLITLKFFLTEGDTIHPPVRARFNLEFGPEDE